MAPIVEYRRVTRDLGRLSDTSFDLLVIGAGIYGATIAWDAALRGLSVALIDRGDFGGATSANSLKTVHGGLRSLQRGAIGEMRLFVRERRSLLRIAPHLVAPLTFVVPTSRHPVRNRPVMRAALALNDLLAADRNQGLLPSRHLHGGRLLSRAEVLAIAPELDGTNLTGGASWCDAQMLNSERLVLAFVQSAASRGALVANHAAALRLLRVGGRVEGAVVRDEITGNVFDVRARVTVNAAGAWTAALSGDATGRPASALLPSLSRALNVVTRRPASGPAVGGVSEGRFFFKVPWRGLTMYGTSHDPYELPPEQARPTAEPVQALLRDVNRAFPGALVGFDEVTLVHWGLLPSVRSAAPHVQLSKDSVVRDHRLDGVEGLVSVVGVRYTTARKTAEDAVNIAAAMLGGGGATCATAEAALAGGDLADEGALAAEVRRAWPVAAEEDVARLLRSYGTGVSAVLRLLQEPRAAERLSRHCPVTRAEVLHAARHELALTLADALVRRTEAGSAGHPGAEAAAAAGEVMAAELGWTAERLDAEIEACRAYYAPVPATAAQAIARPPRLL